METPLLNAPCVRLHSNTTAMIMIPNTKIFGSFRLACGVCLAALGASCSVKGSEPGAPAPAGFPLLVRVHSEGQTPVPGVTLALGTQTLGTTDQNGTLRITLQGEEGEKAALSVKCPPAYASPERPLVIGLRRLAGGSTPVRFDAECFSLLHSVVVGVRAENGPHLPILRLKTVVGHTDDAGIAHVLLQASSNEAVALTLDTTGRAGLLPQNPTLDFVTHDRDELVLVSQKFTLKAAPRPHATPRNIPRQL